MTFRQILLVVSLFLLIVSFAIAMGWVHSRFDAWWVAGLWFFVVSFLAPERPVTRR